MKSNIKKIIIKAAALSGAIIIAAASLCGCENGDAWKMKEKPEDFTRYWLQWSGCYNESLRRPDGTMPYWDWDAAEKAHVNKMHIIFNPTDENGNKIHGVPDTESLIKECGVCNYELTKTHEAGIKVIAYSDDVQFVPASAAKMGVDLDDICALRDGKQIVDYGWIQGGAYIACINSKPWREWLSKNVRALAEAGYDGLQFDYGPYAAAGYGCTCKYCLEGWKKYSIEHLGREVDLTGCLGFDFTKEEDREFFLWKVKCMNDFLIETSAPAFEINPDFEFLMNQNAFGVTYPFEALAGAWNHATSELWGCNCGQDSTMYMNRLTEALGFDELNTIVNDGSQINDWRYKAILAENFSTTGGITMCGNEYYDIAKKLFDFSAEHKDIYLGTQSAAKAALLYSAESEVFSIPTGSFAALPSIEVSKSRMADRILDREGILHDFVVAEKESAIEELEKYDAVFVPDYTYFNDETWKPVLKGLAKKGTRIIVLTEGSGSEAAKYVNKNAKGIRADRKIINDVRDSEEIKTAMKGTKAVGQIVNVNNSGDSQITVRSYDGKTFYIHVTLLGGKYGPCETWQELEYKLPGNAKEATVKAYAPFDENTDLEIEYSIDKGVLYLETDDFDTYAVIEVTLV